MKLETSPSLSAFLEALKKGGSFLVEGLWDTPKACLASSIAKATGRPLLLITGGMREDRLFGDLGFFAPGDCIEFPAWETLPGEEIAPSPDILGKRFEAIHSLIHRKAPPILLCPLPSLLQKVLPQASVLPLLTVWKKGTETPFESLPEFLTLLGFERAPVVSDKGEFAIRGGILDLFPVASPDPYRIEFFGNTIEEIRTFDPVGQKTVGKAEQIFLSPAVELPFLRGASRLCPIFDYLGEDLIVLWDDLLAIEDTYVALKEMPAARSTFLYSLEEILKKLGSKTQHIFCSAHNIEDLSQVGRVDKRSKYLAPISFEAFQQPFVATRFFHPFCKIEPVEETLESKELSVLFLNANDTEEEEVKKRLKSWPEKSRFEKGVLTSGFLVSDIPYAVIPNAEITHRSHVRRQKWRSTHHTPAAEFHDIDPWRFRRPFPQRHRALSRHRKTHQPSGRRDRIFILEYADESKLFVPLSQAYLVSRYIGAQEEPPHLSQLGGKRWQATALSAQAQIVGYANDLLQL